MANQQKRHRSIIVTGASSGIGAHCARRLKAKGWTVVASARKPADRAGLEAEGLGGLYLDYEEPHSIEAFFGEALEACGGRIDALFNNGAYGQAGAVEDLPPEALRRQLETNVVGWHDLTRRTVAAMRGQAGGGGRIVHCSSVLGFMPLRYRGAYCASKYALEGLMLCLRAELAGSGIAVSLIEPGPIESRFSINGLEWFERYVDRGRSVHRLDYERQIERLSGDRPNRFRLKPDAVFEALDHALNSASPKAHYPVTTPSRAARLLRRVLPSELFYRMFSMKG